MRRLVILFFSLLGVSVLADPLYHPKLRNSKDGAHHDFPMGVLSATGRLVDGSGEILIMDVGKGGLAEGSGLKVGDRVLAAGGKPFVLFSKSTETGLQGPQADLGKALTGSRRLTLRVRRGEEEQALMVTLPKRATKGELLRGIADHLQSVQEKNGRWRPGVGGDADVYTSCFCALTLLAADDAKYLPAIKAGIGFINKMHTATIELKKPRGGPKNWQAATAAILLAEYQLATGDTSFAAELKTNCELLAARVSKSGTMGHHFDIPYGGGGLVIINVQAHLAWALAEKCGYKIDRGAWDRSMKEVRASIDKKTGALGYSARATWSPDIPARTGAMAAALMVAGVEKELARQFADALVKHHGRMRHAHAMSSIGIIYGFAGLKMAHPEGHAEVMKNWEPYVELSRNAAGSAAYFGGKRNIGGDEYLGLQSIGNAMTGLMIASAEGRLLMHY